MRIILTGALGRMGQKVIEAINQNDDLQLVLAVDINKGENTEFSQCSLVASLEDEQAQNIEADCLIDFSYHTSAPEIAQFITKTKTPAVIATTGHTVEETKVIEAAAQFAPVFFAGNMSVGVGLTSKLACEVATMFPDADCEIVESHHNKKVDSPSGTALMIARAIQHARGGGEIVCGRSGMEPREPGQIGVSAMRLGNIVGEHTIIFDTGTQAIEIKHTSHDRALFADGAIDAARFLQGKENKVWKMEDLLCK